MRRGRGPYNRPIFFRKKHPPSKSAWPPRNASASRLPRTRWHNGRDHKAVSRGTHPDVYGPGRRFASFPPTTRETRGGGGGLGGGYPPPLPLHSPRTRRPGGTAAWPTTSCVMGTRSSGDIVVNEEPPEKYFSEFFLNNWASDKWTTCCRRWRGSGTRSIDITLGVIDAQAANPIPLPNLSPVAAGQLALSEKIEGPASAAGPLSAMCTRAPDRAPGARPRVGKN